MNVKLPPHSIEAEKGVLGSLLLDPDAIDDVADLLSADDFYRDTHATIYRAIMDLNARPVEVDAVTLADELIHRGQLERIGGDDAIADLIASVPHAVNARYYAQIVRKKAITRRAVQIGGDLVADGYANNLTADELLGKGISRLMELEAEGMECEVHAIGHHVRSVMRRIALRQEGHWTGLPTGLADLDDLLCGLHPGQLIVVAARPSIGKTALALSVAAHIAWECGGNPGVLLSSLEMDGDEIAERLIVARSGLDGHRLRQGDRLTPAEQDQLDAAYADVHAQDRIVLDDAGTRTPTAIHATARRLKRTGRLGLLIVDYLQLVDGSEAGRKTSRQEQVAYCSRRFKSLARDLRVPVLLLCQLNRQAEGRADKRPMLADLRESGAIENDADVVILLHRPEFYDPTQKQGQAELIVAKNRNGRTGTVEVAYIKSQARFADLDTTQDFGPGPGGEPF